MALSSLRTRAERLLSRAGASSGILMYHRVAEETHDPWDLCVSPRTFAEQMAALAKLAECVDLLELGRPELARRSDRVRIALTFDDGYRDNLSQALPILERHRIPATVFIVSGAIGRGREFWWDALERCLLRPKSLPERLELDVAGLRGEWRLGITQESDPAWRADGDTPGGPRERLFLELWNALVLLETERQEAVLAALMDWASVDPDGSAPDRRPLAAAELGELAKHPLIRIGCHTKNHRSLSDLPVLEVEREIAEAQRALEAVVKRPLRVFSYPYGRVDEAAEQVVRRAGFALACSSRPSPVTPLASRWRLPRLQVTERSGDRFASQLSAYLPKLRHGSA